MLVLASCLCREIAEAELPDPCFCGVIPGQAVPLDYCAPCGSRGGKCGMAWVRLAGVAPANFTGTSGDITRCATPLQATIEVGVARCAPTGSLDSLPTMADQLAAAELQTADMAAALRAIRCCTDNGDIAVTAWAPFGPTGGCLGGSWNFTLYEV